VGFRNDKADRAFISTIGGVRVACPRSKEAVVHRALGVLLLEERCISLLLRWGQNLSCCKIKMAALKVLELMKEGKGRGGACCTPAVTVLGFVGK
jgi:hypothetical protein